MVCNGIYFFFETKPTLNTSNFKQGFHWKSVFCLFLIFVFYLSNTWSWFNDNSLLGGFDWDQHLFYTEFLRKSYVEFHSVFFWNPYYGSGFPVLENPNSKIFSPTHILALFFPSLLALKLSFLFYFFLSGFLNYFSLLKFERTNHWITILFIVFFQFSGFFFQRIYVGHMNLIPALFLPSFCLLFLLYIKESKRIYIFLFTFVSYILLTEGTIYILTQGVFILFFLSFSEFLKSEKKWKFSKRIFVIVSISLVLTSFKWLPSLFFILSNGRHFVPDVNSLEFLDYISIFFGNSQHPILSKSISKMQYNYWEYGNYIGFYPLPLLFVLPFVKIQRKLVFGLSLFCLVLMAGNFSHLSPAYFLEKLPIYSMERVYARWSVSVLFLFFWFLCVNLQQFLILIESKSDRIKRVIYALFFLILSAFVYDTKKMNTKYAPEIFRYKVPKLEKNEKLFPVTIETNPKYGPDSSMYPALLGNYTVLDSYENLNFYFLGISRDQKDYKGEFWMIPNHITVNPIKWTPDTWTFSNIKHKQILILNQKFHPNFFVDDTDLIVCEWNGFLAVQAKKDVPRFALSYSIFRSFLPFQKTKRECE